MATTGKTHHIKLGGKYYQLEKHTKKAQDSFVPRYSTSEIPSDRDFSVFNRWQTKSAHLGEGQDNLDITDEDVSAYRYKSSTGIDVSEKYKLQTLYDINTDNNKTSTNTAYLPLTTANLFIAMGDGDNVYLWGGASWGSASDAGLGGSNIQKLISDGTDLFASDSAVNNLIRKGVISDKDTIAWSNFTTNNGAEDMIWNDVYLYAVDEDVFYQLDTSGAEVYKYPSSGTANVDLNCVCEHNGDIYFGGFLNTGKTRLFKFDGTDVIEVSLGMPFGDELQCLHSALGRLWLGTRRPVKGTANTFEGHLYSWDESSLTHHWKIDADTSTYNYGISRIYHMGTNLYFNWNHHTGLGRYDLKEGGVSRDIQETLTASNNNRVVGITSLWDKLAFTVLNKGCYIQGTSRYSSATFTSSFNNLNTVHKKLWPSAEIRTEPLGTSDTVEFQYTTDKGAQYISAGTMSQVATKYKADAIPASSSPAWTKSGSATTEEISPTGILHINGSSSLYYYRTENSISNTTGSCLQMKCKMDAGGALYLKIYDGTKYSQVYISDSNIVLHDSSNNVQGRVWVDMTSSYQTIRVTCKANVVKVYLNGALAITGVATSTTATKQMRFDVISGTSSVDIYIDHVFYSISDAYSPDDNDLTDTFYELDLGNVISDNLGYKLILTNTSGNLVVLPVSVKSIPLMSNKKIWELTVKATDFPEQLTSKFGTNKSGEDYMSDLWEAQGGRQILEFEDIDGTSYEVIIIQGPEQELIGRMKKDKLEALMKLTLWEV